MPKTDHLTVPGPRVNSPKVKRMLAKPRRPKSPVDKDLDQGLKESFPASDPPAVTREPMRDQEQHPKAKGHKTH